MKKPKLLYIVCLLIPCLLLSKGFAQEYAAQWHLPEGAKARLGNGKLNNIIFSPDGTRVAVPTSIGIWVYDVHTTKAVSLFSGIQTGEIGKYLPTVPPEALTFSDDALIVASAHADKIYVWDTATGTAFAMLDEHPNAIKAIALSPDNTKLATAGGDWIVRLWDVGTGKYINSLSGHPGAVNAIAFSPDGKILASAGTRLRLWNADTGELLNADNNDLGSIDHLVFSPDGKTLASSNGWSHAVHLWDVDTSTIKKKFKKHNSKIRDIAFSPDGRRLVSVSSDGEMRLTDLSTDAEPKRLPTPEDKTPQPVPAILKLEALKQAYLPRRRDDVYSVGFSEDATQLISVSKDGSLHVWDVETGRYRTSFSLGAYSDQVYHIAFSEDGKFLASNDGFEERVRVWDVENATQHAILTPGQGNVFNPLRHLIVSSGIKKIVGRELQGAIQTWNAETVEHLSSIPTDRMIHYWPLLLSPDGKFLAGTDILSKNQIELWETDLGAPLFTLEGHASPVTEYAFSPDSKIFVSGGRDGTIILWDVKTGDQRNSLTGHTASISALAFSADGKTLASGSGNEIRLWDPDTSTLTGILDTGLNVQALAFAPDGKRLACGTEDGRIQVWALVPNFQVQSTFAGHQGAIYVLMFSPDGKTLASGSNDGTVLLWDMER
ncbi:MAG: WD40 repeat domain-containing protein [Candidatus Poribacteria bacterium]|nr:WD40 repeat domain-containing protein [Candidatus Poribacteria bacterium]